MEFEDIVAELLKNGFSLNEYGSLEKTIGDIDIEVIEHPFYHVVQYSKKSDDGRTLYVPSDIKLPKKCEVGDVLFVIDSLVQGIGGNKIVMEIFKRLNPE